MRRVSNIVENPNVCFIVDEYSEDWRELQYVIVDGTATILNGGKEIDAAISRLRKKYPQYHSMNLEGRPVIKITPVRIIAWTTKPLTGPRMLKTKGYD